MNSILTNKNILPAGILEGYYEDALILLQKLVAASSFSGEEDVTADLIEFYLHDHGFVVHSRFNNVWTFNQRFDRSKPTILLAAHHDTAKPGNSYTRDPFKAEIVEGKLYGLGSNDAGGSLAAMLTVFCYLNNCKNLPYNLCFAAVAEEEISGDRGLACILPHLGKTDLGIIGGPTGMDLCISEMGHLILDCICHGEAGHAANPGGVNAVYQALKDIQWFSTYQFPRTPAFLFPVKMTVTGIQGGIQDNVVPDHCRFVVDIRSNTCYSTEELLTIIRNHTCCEITVRPGISSPVSLSSIHPIVSAATSLGMKTVVAKLSSDRSLLDCPSVVIGPGDPRRSHTADEYIHLDEIHQAVKIYLRLLERLTISLINPPVNED